MLACFVVQAGLLPAAFPDVQLNSQQPFTLTSFALSLLLVSFISNSTACWEGEGDYTMLPIHPSLLCTCPVLQLAGLPAWAEEGSRQELAFTHPFPWVCAHQVFRTNSSYSRWLDARKAWGLVLNRSRDITRQVRCVLLQETCRDVQRTAGCA
jgi:predicted membrane chloride channel (bestrophin family)